jgi:hypothetical protein
MSTLDTQFTADGRHKLPLEADVRKAIRKQAGDTVAIRLDERLDD